MSSSLWVQGREVCAEGPFKGKHVAIKKVDNLREELDFWDRVDLIYLTFALSEQAPTNEQLHSSAECYLSLCVLDLDFKDDRRQQIAAATLAGDVAAVKMLCDEALGALHSFFSPLKVPYRVYASGSKGIHVYAQDPRLLIKSDRGTGVFTSRMLRTILGGVFKHEPVLLDYLNRGIIDLSPYHSGKGIRPFSCAHPVTGVVPFVVCEYNWPGDDTWLDWTRKAIRESSYARIESFVDIETVIEATNKTVTRRQGPKPVSSIDGFSDKPLLEFLREQSGQPTMVLNKTVKKFGYYTLPQGKGTWCAIAKRFHGTMCSNWRSFENGVHVCCCFNAECSDKRFVVRKPVDIPVTFPRDTEIAQENLTVLASTENSTYLPDASLDLLQTHTRVMLASPMGGGKTYRVMQFIEKLPPETSIVAIGSRIQQIKAWHSKFSRLGFDIYDESKGSLFSFKRMLVCLNSLPRLLGPGGEVPSIDVLVLDECDSAARWLGGPLLGSSTNASQSLIFLILQLLIARAKRVIAMDGLPTKCTGRFFEVMNCFDKFHWVVHNSLKFKQWTFVNSTTYFTNAFKNQLKLGKRIFFVSNSKKFLYLFADIAVKLCGMDRQKLLVISGDMPHENRIAAGNPEDWIAYNAIFCNGSLGPGASFDSAHFHSVFALVNVRNGVTPVDIAQLVERPRHLIDGQVVAMVLKKEPDDGYKTELDILRQKQKTVGQFYGCAVPVMQIVEDERLAERKKELKEKEQAALAKGLAAKSKKTSAKAKKTIQHRPLTFKTVYDKTTGELREELADPGITIRLVFEETAEMRLAAAVDELAKYWCRDSETFLKELQSIVTRGGAGIMTIGQRTVLNNEGKDLVLGSHCGYFKTLKKNELQAAHNPLEHIEDSYYLRTISSELSPEKLDKAKQLAEVDKPGVMKRFAIIFRSFDVDQAVEIIPQNIDKECTKLFRVDLGKKRTRTEQQGPFSKIFVQADGLPRATINRKVTTGELFNYFNNLLVTMNFEFSQKDKNFTGSFQTRLFATMAEPVRNSLTNSMLELCKLRHREDPTFNWAELKRSKNDLTTFTKWILKLYEWCGFPLVKAKRHRTHIAGVSSEGSKTVWYDLEPDQKIFNFRKALLGYSADGSDIGSINAVNQYFQ